MEPVRHGHTKFVSPIAEAKADILLALPPDPSAARRARRARHEAGLPEDLQSTVDLVATELVANALRHGRPGPDDRILFAAHFNGDFVRLEVADPGSGFDLEEAKAGSGYGLRMVDKLASRWGAERLPGSRVWFELDRRSKRWRFDRSAD
jgi:two-component sensor histidine kinase